MTVQINMLSLVEFNHFDRFARDFYGQPSVAATDMFITIEIGGRGSALRLCMTSTVVAIVMAMTDDTYQRRVALAYQV